jgi:hypothetical protein
VEPVTGLVKNRMTLRVAAINTSRVIRSGQESAGALPSCSA